jgi:uncharacterized protein YigE (DUF2233 family)
MPLKNHVKLCLLLAFVSFTLLACDFSLPVSSTPTTTPSNQSNSQLNTWYTTAAGVAIRYEDWKDPAGDEDVVTIVRFDLHYVKLSVAYQPTQPLLMGNWMSKERATAIINGGYFDQQENAEALVVANGQTFGTSYSGFGGMLSVNTQGQTTLRALSQQPYNPNSDQLQQATQSSPMLIFPGGKRAQFYANAASSRRSAVAVDKQGHLLFISSPDMAFSLDEFADLLVASDLSIDVALNLDGGASTGLYVNAGIQHVAIDSFVPLPIVVIVREK